MANLKSAIKRVKVNEKKRQRNQSFKSAMRTNIKRVEHLVEANDLEEAKKAFEEASQSIDKAVQKGVIHRNNGNRQKRKLAKKIREIA
ncbi:MAG TPA: 30S ribosomal protein S20 [Bacillota bacterium]|nr:30S ribosomal protein S20 [Bacillota bacterium]